MFGFADDDANAGLHLKEARVEQAFDHERFEILLLLVVQLAERERRRGDGFCSRGSIGYAVVDTAVVVELADKLRGEGDCLRLWLRLVLAFGRCCWIQLGQLLNASIQRAVDG